MKAVEVRDVTLSYRMARNRAGSIKEFAINLVKRQVQYERFTAVQNVSFEVDQGEVFAIIGPNGAGKSTLMKVIARVLPPSSGRVIVRGSLAPMIELGAGFNGELTGYENVVLYGTLLGRKPAEMRERAPEIARWAGLDEFLDVPIRSYSSGMLARLGFAVATDTVPDVLVVDEVLSVGDAQFNQKSKERMITLIGGGSSVVFVSHELNSVREICQRAMWLDHGRIKMIGPTDEVAGAYEASVRPG